MRVGRARPRLATMMTPTILRVGAIVAVLSVIGEVSGVLLAPDWNASPDVGARTVAAADIWKAWLLIQVVGILFIVPAVAVVLMALEGTDGAGWARLCLPMISVAAALACAQILIGGSRANLVEAASTESASRAGYLAAFDAVSAATDFIDFGGLLALGMALVVMATAMLVSRVYARAIGWLCAGAAGLMLVGLLGGLAVSDAASVLIYAGFVLFMIALIALAVSMWRRANRVRDAAVTMAPSSLDPAPAAR
jgi:hypothetical protein